MYPVHLKWLGETTNESSQHTLSNPVNALYNMNACFIIAKLENDNAMH
jgi:hypothetical protein